MYDPLKHAPPPPQLCKSHRKILGNEENLNTFMITS